MKAADAFEQGASGAKDGREGNPRWRRPKKFDRNLVVIGAGAAGLTTSFIAAALKAKVTLVESGKMGGDCLNYGCVPSKALLRSAKLAQQMRGAAAYGLGAAVPKIDFAEVMARVHRVIDTIAPHDSTERFTALGIEVLHGHARLVSPWLIEIDDAGAKRTISTRSIVVATGSRPRIADIPGLDGSSCLTSDNVWDLTALPRRLLVLGGGAIGCEMAQAFARLGSIVTQVEAGPRLLPHEDDDAASLVAAALRTEGITVLTGHEAMRCEPTGDGEPGARRLIVKGGGRERAIEFDAILCAIGRAPRTEGFGLDELGIALDDDDKSVAADATLRTRYPNIFVCGDVAGPYQFTHVASHQAWYAAVNSLLGPFGRFRVDYRVIPWTTFTDPEVARAGLSEREAKERGVAYELTRFDLAELDRAVTDGAGRGFIKVLTVPGKDRILGVTIVGEHAGDVIAEFVLAMKQGLGLKKILDTIHIYPTLAEANHSVAVVWRLEHAPQRVLAWLERFFAWRRSA
ncbi:MAG: FAD-dependent oxidoreductase [Caldimonas sp.]